MGLNTRTTKVPGSKAKIVFWTNLYCINLGQGSKFIKESLKKIQEDTPQNTGQIKADKVLIARIECPQLWSFADVAQQGVGVC